MSNNGKLPIDTLIRGYLPKAPSKDLIEPLLNNILADENIALMMHQLHSYLMPETGFAFKVKVVTPSEYGLKNLLSYRQFMIALAHKDSEYRFCSGKEAILFLDHIARSGFESLEKLFIATTLIPVQTLMRTSSRQLADLPKPKTGIMSIVIEGNKTVVEPHFMDVSSSIEPDQNFLVVKK